MADCGKHGWQSAQGECPECRVKIGVQWEPTYTAADIRRARAEGEQRLADEIDDDIQNARSQDEALVAINSTLRNLPWEREAAAARKETL